MKITQTVVFSKEDLINIINGQVYAFVNPGDDREILIMSEETFEEWKEPDCGFLE